MATRTRTSKAKGTRKKKKTAKARKAAKPRVDLHQKRYEHHHWDFAPIFPPHPHEVNLPDDWAEHAGDFDVESQCGPNDESQPVELYDGTLGVTRAFVDTHQGRVGNIQWNDNLGAIYNNPGNVTSRRWCTGTLISCDLFLTAGHCFDQTGGGWQRPLVNGTTNIIPPEEIATNMHVNFNYQVDQNGILRPEEEFAVIDLLEYRLNGIDYAILRLDGNPGNKFGWAEVSTTDASDGDMLCIIQHPAGLPKRIEAGPAFHLHDTRIGYDSIDTQGGSSGSGILSSPDGLIVGVHTNGGCDVNQTGHNHGQRITSVRNASPILQDLAAQRRRCLRPLRPLRWDKPLLDNRPTPPKLMWPGDGTLKFLDDPGGGWKFFSDPSGTLKHIDDVKAPFLDKQFSDAATPLDPSTMGGMPSRTPMPSAAPFVLATPHHSMAWSRSGGAMGAGHLPPGSGGELDARVAQSEATLAELSTALQGMAAALHAIQENVRQLRDQAAG